VIRVVPKDSKTAKDNGLSWNRLCCSVQATIRLSSVSKDRQLAASSANKSRVLN
jgi:hypothetical protein